VFLQKSPWNMMLFGTAVVTGGMLIWPLFNRAFAGNIQQVGALEAVQLMNRRDAVVLDVRTKPEYSTGHIPGSRNIPYADLTERMREIEKLKSRPIIVCSESGARSSKVSGALKKIGLSDIFVLRGNLTGWAEASLPLEK
jgi:rhodanese-related sulfurtransferase